MYGNNGMDISDTFFKLNKKYKIYFFKFKKGYKISAMILHHEILSYNIYKLNV